MRDNADGPDDVGWVDIVDDDMKYLLGIYAIGTMLPNRIGRQHMPDYNVVCAKSRSSRFRSRRTGPVDRPTALVCTCPAGRRSRSHIGVRKKN